MGREAGFDLKELREEWGYYILKIKNSAWNTDRRLLKNDDILKFFFLMTLLMMVFF